MILWICIGIFAALLILGAPILLCLGLPPVIWLLQDGSIPNLVMGQKMYTAVDSFSLIAIPFFMLAGQVMERTGITEAIVDFANSVIGWVRGGLACTVELAGILMAGISGSSNADASALGAICLRALKKGGYEDGWASAIVVSAAGHRPHHTAEHNHDSLRQRHRPGHRQAVRGRNTPRRAAGHMLHGHRRHIRQKAQHPQDPLPGPQARRQDLRQGHLGAAHAHHNHRAAYSAASSPPPSAALSPRCTASPTASLPAG